MKIFCVGRNYVAHAEELGNDVPDRPLIFSKPASALVRKNKPVYYPGFTSDLHYEGELVIRICKNGKSIEPHFAGVYYKEVSLGFDLTARDLQADLKKKGWPWDIAKGFDGAAPIGSFVPKEEVMDASGNFQYNIHLNGKQVQFGDTSLMIFPIDTLISYISGFFTLREGDLIFTGTPKGVGSLSIGDQLSASFGDQEILQVRIK